MNRRPTAARSTCRRPGWTAPVWQGSLQHRRGQAAILEFRPPDCRYWSFQVMNDFWESQEFDLRQTSLNGHQAPLDPDGVFRGVIAVNDPGIPNWLDPVGHRNGLICARVLYPRTTPEVTIRTVPLNRLREALHPDTPEITALTRSESLRVACSASGIDTASEAGIATGNGARPSPHTPKETVMGSAPDVVINQEGGVTSITLHRPQVKNALTFAMCRELISLFRGLRDDAVTRVVLLRGAVHFSSGAESTTFRRYSMASRRHAAKPPCTRSMSCRCPCSWRWAPCRSP